MKRTHNGSAPECGFLETGYTVLATDQHGQPQWHQFADAHAALHGWGELLTLRSAGHLPDDEAHLLREELQIILEGASAANFGLHDVAHSLNMVSGPLGVVLWAGPLTVHYEFATAFAA
jgi:hypothetical protein